MKEKAGTFSFDNLKLPFGSNYDNLKFGKNQQ